MFRELLAHLQVAVHQTAYVQSLLKMGE
jgi:hypothetical protein